MRGTGLVLLTLVAVAVPRLAASAVVVAEPTGNTDLAFLAELKASLETVAAEAPAELNAELRASAKKADEGVEITVTLVPEDGPAPVAETRVASKASALAQARAVARFALETLTVEAGGAKAETKVVIATEKIAAPAPLPERYDRRDALRMTLLPTILFPIVGGGMLVGGVFMPNTSAGIAFGGVGGTLAWLGVTFGPTVGYFWLGRWQHALGMSGLRILTQGAGMAAMFGYFASLCDDEDQDPTTKCGLHDSGPFFLGLSIVLLTSSLLITVIDAALVGRAVDRANAEWRKKNNPTVQMTPVAWTSDKGDTTYGLAIQGTF